MISGVFSTLIMVPGERVKCLMQVGFEWISTLMKQRCMLSLQYCFSFFTESKKSKSTKCNHHKQPGFI